MDTIPRRTTYAFETVQTLAWHNADLINGEYINTTAFSLRNYNVIAKYCGYWPGPEKNVHVWYELNNGKAVGFNENPSRGYSFPVIAFTNEKKAAVLAQIASDEKRDAENEIENAKIADKQKDNFYTKRIPTIVAVLGVNREYSTDVFASNCLTVTVVGTPCFMWSSDERCDTWQYKWSYTSSGGSSFGLGGKDDRTFEEVKKDMAMSVWHLKDTSEVKTLHYSEVAF